MRRVEGSVERLVCRDCSAHTFYFTFSGDTDMATFGLGAACSCAGPEIVLVEMTNAQWDHAAELDSVLLEQRIAHELNRSDFRVPKIVRYEQQGPSAAGKDFVELMKVYRSARVVCACICCGNGEAVSLETMTPEEFRNSGGAILLLGDLELADTG